MVSIFLSLRLVASIVGSIVLLNETPTKALTWVGFALIMIVMAAFVGIQYYKRRKAEIKGLTARFIDECDDEEINSIATLDSVALEQELGLRKSGMLNQEDHHLSGLISGLDHRRFTVPIIRPNSIRVFNKWEIDNTHRATKSSVSLLEGLGHSLNEGGLPWKESESEDEEFEMHIEKRWSVFGDEVPTFHPIHHKE